MNPLELWIAAYILRHPEASLGEALRESASARQEAYQWLFRTSHRAAQNKRIRTMVETDAFVRIHEGWSRLGYPFGHLVPSYATAIGSSGDRPSALAELMGIIINDGVRVPTYRFEDLHFAEHTPYEVQFRRQASAGEQVLRPEIAQMVKQSLYEVVESGTARRARHGFRSADGTEIWIGGKTGTGDHRYETFRPNGSLISSEVMNRSAVFAFFIGDRFFGALTAYVPGPEAKKLRIYELPSRGHTRNPRASSDASLGNGTPLGRVRGSALISVKPSGNQPVTRKRQTIALLKKSSCSIHTFVLGKAFQSTPNRVTNNLAVLPQARIVR